MAEVTITALSKRFPGGVQALDGLDLSIADGEFFALLGPSGCGKTTLLRTIAGLESATSGTVRIGDRDVTGLPPGARDVAMVFQDYALFPHMSVRDNIAYPLKIKRRPRAERARQADSVAGQLGLSTLMQRRPAALSGGQQQRVALARAVACHPRVFLFDEPLSNLDARLRLEARTFLKRLQRELAVTTVFVTHDQAEALALADRIAVMEAGQIRQVGTPREVFGRPATVFVANFIGSTPMNLLPGKVTGDRLVLPGGELPRPAGTEELADGEAVTVGIRPEYVAVEPRDAAGRASSPAAAPAAGSGSGSAAGSGSGSAAGPAGSLVGEVSIIENLGTASLVTVEVDGALVGGTVPEGEEPEPGTPVRLRPAPTRVLVYRGADGTLVG